MGASLTEPDRVGEEGPWVVNPFSQGRNLTVPEEKASANSVPAAAVIRRRQALSGITGRKAFVGGSSSLLSKLGAQLRRGSGNWGARGRQGQKEFPV